MNVREPRLLKLSWREIFAALTGLLQYLIPWRWVGATKSCDLRTENHWHGIQHRLLGVLYSFTPVCSLASRVWYSSPCRNTWGKSLFTRYEYCINLLPVSALFKSDFVEDTQIRRFMSVYGLPSTYIEPHLPPGVVSFQGLLASRDVTFSARVKWSPWSCWADWIGIDVSWSCGCTKRWFLSR